MYILNMTEKKRDPVRDLFFAPLAYSALGAPPSTGAASDDAEASVPAAGVSAAGGALGSSFLFFLPAVMPITLSAAMPMTVSVATTVVVTTTVRPTKDNNDMVNLLGVCSPLMVDEVA
jgi:hypothetical protein